MTRRDIQNRIDNLSSRARKLFLLKLVELLNQKLGKTDSSERKRLVAYFEGNNALEGHELRSFLTARLPDYMVPSAIVPIEKIPTLPNGKIDRAAISLTNALSTIPRPAAAVTSELESQLIQIWEDVLGFSPITVKDNFFEIGGDSILSIQIIAKARKLGIKIAPNQLFEHQTVEALALFTSSDKLNDTEREFFVGELPLTPIQNWFFETHLNAPQYWNQAVKISGSLLDDRKIVSENISYLLAMHESLRLGFEFENGQWKGNALETNLNDVFIHIDLSDVASENIYQAQERKLSEVQADFNLKEGKLFQCLYFDFGANKGNYCILLAHHLIIDAVSWSILIEQLQTGLVRTTSELNITNEASGMSLKDWATHLVGLVDLKKNDKEPEYWELQTTGLADLPTDRSEKFPILEKDVACIDFILDLDTTSKLLTANEYYKTKTEELLLTALQTALLQWTGGNDVLIGLERHGREVTDISKDPSEIIGWLTSYFPIKLGQGEDLDMGQKIKLVKEKLRNVPDGGIGFGILKYLGGALREVSMPKVVFNFLGMQNSTAFNETFSVEPIDSGLRHPLSERYYLIEINSVLKDGELSFSWSYSRRVHTAKTIENIISNFKKEIYDIIDFKIEGGFNYSPSDFPEADLNQDDLDNLLSSLE